MTDLDTPLAKSVVRAKPAVLADLDRAFGIRTVGDLLRHYPRRYAEWGEPTGIGGLHPGEEVTILAEVVHTTQSRIQLKNGRPGSITKVTVRDGTGETMTLTFFGGVTSGGRVKSPVGSLKPGSHALFAGTVSKFRDQLQLDRPEFHRLDDPAEADEMMATMVPIYPATKTVRSWEIGRAVRTLLDVVPVDDPLPTDLRSGRQLLDLATALRFIHRPADYGQVGAARKRLAWDEAFAVQLALVARKQRADAAPAVARPRRADGLLSTFDSALPYELTAGQRAVGEQLAVDLGRPHPMHRLLQGEVGSGKTVCALRAMLQVVDAGGQAALLAPTEVLAAQHQRSIRELLGPLGRAGELDGAPEATSVVLVTGSQSAGARRQAVAAVSSGAAGIVVGTHALLSEGMDFRDLGLVVVDEQHRFGVQQRDTLRARSGGTPPHVLVMTATPIPRTVAMTVFGDLETSELTELPRGRSPITTHLVPAAEKPKFLARAWQRVREEIEAGHQAYVVCPRIGGTGAEDEPESTVDSGDPAGDGGDGPPRRPPLAVLDVAPILTDGPLAGLRVGVLHGRLPGDEKDAVMRAFAAGRLDALVATTVIEVGVDVPNATVMTILDADRFGISQLHQLRGRVGRGSAAGLCFLVTDAPPESVARTRLAAVESTVDGFELARLDLELRREGDVLGEAQSGGSRHLRLLSLARDAELIAQARTEAIRLLDGDPQLHRHPTLAASVQALVDERSAEFLEKG